MTSWIAVDTSLVRDPKVATFAVAIGVPKLSAVGHLVGVWSALAEHSDERGDVSAVPDSELEDWALWRGKEGQFATAFRATFVDGNGCVHAWEERNGAQIRKAKLDAARKREERRAARASAGQSTDAATDSPRTRRRIGAGNLTIPNLPTTTLTAEREEVGNGEVSDAGPQKAEPAVLTLPSIARRLTSAANRGLDAAWGKPSDKPLYASHRPAVALAEHVEQRGIDVAFAEQVIERHARGMNPVKTKRPFSMAYFLPILDTAFDDIRPRHVLDIMRHHQIIPWDGNSDAHQRRLEAAYEVIPSDELAWIRPVLAHVNPREVDRAIESGGDRAALDLLAGALGSGGVAAVA